MDSTSRDGFHKQRFCRFGAVADGPWDSLLALGRGRTTTCQQCVILPLRSPTVCNLDAAAQGWGCEVMLHARMGETSVFPGLMAT